MDPEIMIIILFLKKVWKLLYRFLNEKNNNYAQWNLYNCLGIFISMILLKVYLLEKNVIDWILDQMKPSIFLKQQTSNS